MAEQERCAEQMSITINLIGVERVPLSQTLSDVSFRNSETVSYPHEATAELDPQTEAEIVETIGRLKGRVTILVFSHQSELVGAADAIYQLQYQQADSLTPENK